MFAVILFVAKLFLCFSWGANNYLTNKYIHTYLTYYIEETSISKKHHDMIQFPSSKTSFKNPILFLY
jgi:hypothetical protein